LSWIVFRADIVACVPFHACAAREVSGEWARLPREKAALVSQRGEHLISKKKFVSCQCGEQTKRQLRANFLPRLTHACAAFARGRARAWGHVLLR
jgi:hypothetical protein